MLTHVSFTEGSLSAVENSRGRPEVDVLGLSMMDVSADGATAGQYSRFHG